MIPKASQRGGGQQLATHLLNAIDNERVEILDLRGSIANDLHGAFAEWEAAATGTKCRKYLYSLSVNPDPQQRRLSREEIADFITRAETALGLADQPRALVCHIKDGREHYHVAWSRIDTDKMRAVQLSHDRPKLRAAVREFAREKGLELPDRMKQRKQDRYMERGRQSNHAEKQQEERTGITKEERRRAITEAWHRSDTGQTFIRALEERGYYLAQGDRRGYVVVDRHGEIHSLARQIDGVKTKQINARLIDFPPDKLPAAVKAQEYIRQKNQISLKTHFRQQADSSRTRLDAAHKQRRAVLDKIKKDLEQRHRAERAALLAVQRDRNMKIAKERRESEPKGLAAFLGKITGIASLTKKRQQETDAQRTQAQRETIGQLTRRQKRESRDLARHFRALGRVEKREIRALETKLRREALTQERTAIREQNRPRAPEPTPQRQALLTPEQQHKTKEFTDNARDIAATPAPATAQRKTGGRVLSEKFERALRERKERAEASPEREKEQDREQGRDRSPG